MFQYYCIEVQYMVWKIRDFSVTQILREINFEECRSSEIAILGALMFVNLVDFSILKVPFLNF